VPGMSLVPAWAKRFRDPPVFIVGNLGGAHAPSLNFGSGGAGSRRRFPDQLSGLPHGAIVLAGHRAQIPLFGKYEKGRRGAKRLFPRETNTRMPTNREVR